MATLVLETGAGLSNSNSYVDLAEADTYFESHPYYADAWADIVDNTRRSDLLISASLWLDTNFEWIGYKRFETQAMGWPRTGAYDRYGYLISDLLVPRELKYATAEMAFHLSKGDPAEATQVGAGITDLRIDVIELTFDKGIRPSYVPSSVLNFLRDLGAYLGGVRVRKVIVG